MSWLDFYYLADIAGLLGLDAPSVDFCLTYFLTEGDLEELRLLLFCTFDNADGLVFAISAAADSELF